jgi:hypothetical protein
VATSGDVDAVRFMAGLGFTVEEIGSTTGLDAAEVGAVLAGRHQVSAVGGTVVDGPPVQPVKRGPGRPSTLTPGQAERARVLRGQGLSLARIGEALGVSKQAVWRVTDEPARVVSRSSAPVPVATVPLAPREVAPLLREEELFGDEEWAIGGGLGWSIAVD